MEYELNLFTEKPLKSYHNGIRAVNKKSNHFPEADSIFPAMLGNLIDGSQK